MLVGEVQGRPITAPHPPSDPATPLILFLDRNVAASSVGALAVGTVTVPFTPPIAPPLLISLSAFFVPALTPILAPLITLLLRIANTDLRATVLTNPELDLRLSHRGGGHEKR